MDSLVTRSDSWDMTVKRGVMLDKVDGCILWNAGALDVVEVCKDGAVGRADVLWSLSVS